MNRTKIKEEARELIRGKILDILFPFAILALLSYFSTELVSAFFRESDAMSLFILIEFALCPISFGVSAYLLKFVRKEPYEIKEIFRHYNKFIYILALSLLIWIFTFLWSLLFIIPGIIAAISYLMTTYIMIDGIDDPLQCIRNSKQMMYGYKWDYVKFMFSFIGWFVLVIITFGIALIYVIPYITVSQILYYEELKKITKLD